MSSTTIRLAAEPASSLLATKCEPCKSGAAPLGDEEIARLLQELGPTWVVEPEVGSAASSKPMNALVRTLRFRNFRTALAFANQIGTLAEEQGHHPALRVEWGVVRVEWWTHTAGGIHKNDFIMAAKTDEVVQNAEGLRKAS